MNKSNEKESEVRNTVRPGKFVKVYEFGEDFKPKKYTTFTMERINGAPYYDFLKIEGDNGPVIDSVFPTNVTDAGSSSGVYANESSRSNTQKQEEVEDENMRRGIRRRR